MLTRVIKNIDSTQSQANDIAKKTTLLEAVHLANKAWSSVKSDTIKNCFKKGGFVEENESEV